MGVVGAACGLLDEKCRESRVRGNEMTRRALARSWGVTGFEETNYYEAELHVVWRARE